jgi:hypothetical protein
MNENLKITIQTQECIKLFINILYNHHKPKDYWAKKRGDQMAAPFTSDKKTD